MASICGVVCPACDHCCADLLPPPYLERGAIVAYKVRCQGCESIYVVDMK